MLQTKEYEALDGIEGGWYGSCSLFVMDEIANHEQAEEIRIMRTHKTSHCIGSVIALFLVVMLLPSFGWADSGASAQKKKQQKEQKNTSPRMERPVALDTHLGLGTPVGTGGITATWSMVDWLAIGAGVGQGWDGLQLALMPRLQHLDEGWAYGAGLGISGGEYTWTEPFTWDHPSYKSSETALWLNGQATIDYQFDMGLRLGMQVGYARLLNASSLKCHEDDFGGDHCETAHADDGLQLPFAGVYAGYAL